uniref:non-specific serine/threonine protein kinase n=1 Tax=Elaeis guineensis var. tenera TaxID=51953 RepID=A0A6I9RYI4_ELAGV|nr:probable serine/threonine-protein kinase At1g01540 isoform X2 [Elaeis guineensis]
MSFWDGNFLTSELSKPTSIFGLKLWVVIVICVGAAIVLVFFLLSLCLTARRRRRRRPATITAGKPHKLHLHDRTPPVSKDIPEIVHHRERAPSAAADVQIDIGGKAERGVVLAEQHRLPAQVPAPPSGSTTGTARGESRETMEGTTPSMGDGRPPEVSHLGWGHWYTLREMEDATERFAEENVIGKGEYGIVYRGVLADNTMVAIKNLLNNRGQAEKEFRMVVETIGRIRHKNLVSLLGYCVEGAYRMLVYEFVDNGNLDQWLHGDVGEVSPLTWDIRMKIILGTAKGYVAPEYVSTGMLNDRSDVYSFGVLIMEIISGRAPVDYTRLPGEVNLVEWLKNMVGDRKSEQVVDPKMLEKPYPKALKRALLVALRCVDPDARKRPKMGHVIHMLEMDDLLFRDDRKLGREASAQSSDRYNQGEEGSFSRRDHQTRW